MVSNTKADKSTTPPGNMMLVEIFNNIILIIGDYVLLGGFELGDEVLDVFGVDEKKIRM